MVPVMAMETGLVVLDELGRRQRGGLVIVSLEIIWRLMLRRASGKNTRAEMIALDIALLRRGRLHSGRLESSI